jgi:hypothetical protein
MNVGSEVKSPIMTATTVPSFCQEEQAPASSSSGPHASKQPAEGLMVGKMQKDLMKMLNVVTGRIEMERLREQAKGLQGMVIDLEAEGDHHTKGTADDKNQQEGLDSKGASGSGSSGQELRDGRNMGKENGPNDNIDAGVGNEQMQQKRKAEVVAPEAVKPKKARGEMPAPPVEPGVPPLVNVSSHRYQWLGSTKNSFGIFKKEVGSRQLMAVTKKNVEKAQLEAVAREVVEKLDAGMNKEDVLAWKNQKMMSLQPG